MWRICWMGKQFVAEFVEFGLRCRARCEPMHYLDGRALSFLPNGDIFSLKCC